MIRTALVMTPVAALIALAGTIPVASNAQAAPDGALLFRQRCASCHNMTPGANAVLAPSLIGVMNRKAASTTFNYSPALKASNLTWNRATLDRYLTAPTRLVPGTRMVIGVTDPAQRAAILNYLAKPTK
jgi:cytochrome c